MPGPAPGRCLLDLVVIRILFVFVTALSSYELKPLGLERWPAAGVGLLFGVAVVLFEIRLRNVSLKRLIGAVIGSILGIIGAYLFSSGDSQEPAARARPRASCNSSSCC